MNYPCCSSTLLLPLMRSHPLRYSKLHSRKKKKHEVVGTDENGKNIKNLMSLCEVKEWWKNNKN